jgi:hypothetical protein
MFYLWNYDTQSKGDFFRCGREEFKGWPDIPWTSGEKINSEKIPKVLKYFAANHLTPEDYPLTADYTQFLVSSRIVAILKELNVLGVDFYKSEIVRPNGEIIKDYYTLNILNRISCLDKEKSDFKIKKFGPAEIYDFKKICLDKSKIPSSVKLFRLDEDGTLVFVDQTIKEEFEKEGITGIKLEPICE